MSPWTRRPISLLLALALLAGLGVVLLGESFFHTDDGCPVETHCLTCKWAAGSIAIVTPDLTQALALEPLEAGRVAGHRRLAGPDPEPGPPGTSSSLNASCVRPAP